MMDRYVIEKIIQCALAAVDPQHLVLSRMKLRGDTLTIGETDLQLPDYSRVHVLGVGKGSSFLYQGVCQILGSRIDGGLIVTIPEHASGNVGDPVTLIAGSHPIPDRHSLEAGRRLYGYAGKQVRGDDLVLFLITGGASALVLKPVPGVSPEGVMELTRQLLICGADITEVNCVRKHLSDLKGGRLAALMAPARIVTIALSDVVDSSFSDIGSGPTVGDPTSYSQAMGILGKYRLVDRMAPGIKAHLEKGCRGEVPETPYPEDPLFKGHHRFLIGDNRLALETARAEIRKRGERAVILTSSDQGEAAGAAGVYAALLKDSARFGEPFSPPVVLLAGGELTVTLNGSGTGGRNQELVMHMLKALKDRDFPYHVVSVGSDGRDGPTDAAGAWIDHLTGQKLRRAGLDIDRYIRSHDSYHLFKRLGQLLVTGPTRTNVMDIRLFYLPRIRGSVQLRHTRRGWKPGTAGWKR